MAFTLRNTKSIPTGKENKSTQDGAEIQKISCIVKKYIYKDEESGFFVFDGELSESHPNISVVVEGKKFAGRRFVVVGTSLLMVESVVENQEVEVMGYFEEGKSPGTIQFTATSLIEKIPTKPKAIELFLSSGKIHGIGPATAKKMVTKFGAHTIAILDNEIKELLEIDGISEKKLEIIKKSWAEWRSIYEVVSTMMMYDVGDMTAIKIFNHFKERALYVIQNEPYSLTEVSQIGFKTADKIAQTIGVSPTDINRIEKCLIYSMQKIAEDGSTACTKEHLLHVANNLLNVTPDLLEKGLKNLIEKQELIEKRVKSKVFNDKYKKSFQIVEKDGLALKLYHLTEVRIAKELKRLVDFPVLNEQENDVINDFLEKNEGKLDESQKEAAKNILTNKVSILTGGPGTGKTHTIKTLLKFFKNSNVEAAYIKGEKTQELTKSVLCAPTGRASKRMEELTGMGSSTIHRLLGYKEGQFTYNENNKLKGDVFIVDESSMIDTWLMCAFLKAVPSHARVIFIGDVDQLPSVAAGVVLKDMIDSGKIAVSRLKSIHRQALNSQIIVASHDIINRKVPDLYNYKSDSDFVFIEKDNPTDIKQTIIKAVRHLLSIGVDSNDIQILSPKKETEIGTFALNNSLREILNQYYLEPEENSTNRFMYGDRVMQFKNNKDYDIFNGDVGMVQAVDEDGYIKVMFDDKIVELSKKEQLEVSLSYATTIHKSQGSDYPYVIIPLSKSHMYMWDANLLYTAITRGKKRVILIGDRKTLMYCVSRFMQSERVTGLKDEILNIFNNTYDESKKNKITP